MSIVNHLIEHSKLDVYGNGPNVLTVGKGCRFSTLRSAVNYINSQTYMETLHTGSYTYVDGAKILTASAAISANVEGKHLFLQHSTDDFLYPIEITLPGISTSIKPFYPLWGRTAGATDFSIVSPTKYWVIVLAPGRHEGDGAALEIPPFVSIVGYGKYTSIYEDTSPTNNGGIIHIPGTSQGVKIQGCGIQVHGGVRASCIQLTDVGTSVITNGQRVEFEDLHIASTGSSEDGIWKPTSTNNVIDMVRCNNILATGYYDSFALFGTVRTSITNSEVVSINGDQDLPQCISISGNSLVNSDHRVSGNILRSRNASEALGAVSIGVKVSAHVAGTKDSYVAVANNIIECSGEVNTTDIPGLESKTLGISVGSSGYAVGSLVVHSSNNIFDCSGSRLNYAILSDDDGVIYSSNDRNKDGTAITTATGGTGALTIVL